VIRPAQAMARNLKLNVATCYARSFSTLCPEVYFVFCKIVEEREWCQRISV
jgi:hypothetical protein